MKVYYQVALLLDCIVQEVPKYWAKFQNAKISLFGETQNVLCEKKISHLPDGQACYVTNYYTGSKHDVHILIKNVHIYREMLEKDPERNNYWRIMADKGYAGAY